MHYLRQNCGKDTPRGPAGAHFGTAESDQLIQKLYGK